MKKTRRKKVNDKEIDEIFKQFIGTRKTRIQIAKDFGISRITLYRYLKNFKIA